MKGNSAMEGVGNSKRKEARLTRRRFVIGLGAFGTALVAAPQAFGWWRQAPSAGADAGSLRQWALVIDLRKCEGCVTTGKGPQCTEACNREHFVPSGQEWIKVYRLEQSNGRTYFLPRPCMQCENAPCLNVCPVGATYRNAEGIILIDHRRCVGCRLCMAACPYSARYFNWGDPENPPDAGPEKYSPEMPIPHRRGTVEKCMLCAHRTREGRLPACVEGCPMQALYLGDLAQDLTTNGVEVLQLSRFLAEANAYRLLEDLGTRPRVWYVPGHGQEYGRHSDDQRPAAEARPWQDLTKEAAGASHGG